MSKYRPGCCIDKSCNGSTCMTLPAGTTCGDCRHLNKCVAMFGGDASNTTCDFFPRRFTPAQKVGQV